MNNKYKILANIDSPNDIRQLSHKDLEILSEEISQYIHDDHFDQNLHLTDKILLFLFKSPFNLKNFS